jgi:hypothetical protein
MTNDDAYDDENWIPLTIELERADYQLLCALAARWSAKGAKGPTGGRLQAEHALYIIVWWAIETMMFRDIEVSGLLEKIGPPEADDDPASPTGS